MDGGAGASGLHDAVDDRSARAQPDAQSGPSAHGKSQNRFDRAFPLRSAPRSGGTLSDRCAHAYAAMSAPAFASAKIISAPFSAIMTTAALVLPDTTAGMIEPSTTRRRSMPRTLSRSSTTAVTSLPIRQVLVGWNTVVPLSRANASRSLS